MLRSPRTAPTASRLKLFLCAGAAVIGLAGPALAQDDEFDDATEVDAVVVSAQRQLPGQVIGDIAPEQVLSPREIQAYGAADVAELLDALAPQTDSGQGDGGRPVTLINGGRVSSFREIRDLPTEAIARVDILPEEVSLKYGYPAEQKVVNIVLRPRFRSLLVQGGGSTPTQSGGGQGVNGELARLRIQRETRTMLTAKASHSSPILESERDVIGGEGEARSLKPASTDLTLNAVVARPLGNGVSGSINGSYERSESRSRLGLSPFSSEVLLRDSTSDDGALAAAAAGALAGWQWSYTGSAERSVSRSTTDRASEDEAYTDRAHSTSTAFESDIVLNRSLWDLPAGRVNTALTARVSNTELDSRALTAGVDRSSDLSRSIGQLAANLDVPLTRAGEGFGSAIGKLSGNVNLRYQHLSDFGDLQTLGYGLNWTPVKPLRLLVSFNRSDLAPSMSQLGDPLTITPRVRVFDLARGETVEVTRISGGSPDLGAGQRDTFKLGVTYKPFTDKNLTFQANYVSTRSTDVAAAFPSASTQVEAAFPERFIRDADGRLVQIDARPVAFAERERQELRWGVTYSRPVGRQPTPEQRAAMRQAAEERRRQRAEQGAAETPAPGAQAGAGAATERNAADGPPPLRDGQPRGPGERPGGGFGGGGAGGRGPGGPGGFGRFGGGARGGVFQIGLYHTVAFRDEILIRPGLEPLDLLEGAAIGGGGGSPRHQIDLQTNYTRNGLGVALNGKWRSATSISSPTSEVEFSDFTTFSLRLFADLGAQPIARQHTWLRGARATLSIDNLFDERQEVRTPTGSIPITYQPDLMDPVGRSVKLTIRKLIF